MKAFISNGRNLFETVITKGASSNVEVTKTLSTYAYDEAEEIIRMVEPRGRWAHTGVEGRALADALWVFVNA